MALEKGLCDVDSQAACGGSTSSKNVGSSKAKGGKGKYRTTIPRLPHVPSPLVSILASCVPESVGENNLTQVKNKCTTDDGFYGTETMMV
ncbi:hypothetical protein C1H46_002722 [Malus baccata]|uniref:Uncharacterized protein n=1 Tax=Malus baccata TaxID=106549 RepID=A0A540NKY7_MALBA|nr:hypothetical protein C1H46_002722 [Malus baccata]